MSTGFANGQTDGTAAKGLLTMTYTGPPAPKDGYETYRQASGAARRAYNRGMRDDAQAPFLIIRALFRLIWRAARMLFRIVRRK